MEWSGDFLEAYRAANRISSPLGSKKSYESWPPPRPGVMAVSVDAAIDNNRSQYGTGCVLRDHEGVVVASAISAKAPVLAPALAEASAILRGLALASDYNCREVLNDIQSM